MSKTTPTYRETRYGILSIKAYIIRHHRDLPWNLGTLVSLHWLLCSDIFSDGGIYRKHQVQLWEFIPIPAYQIPIEIKNLDDDIAERMKHIVWESDKKELLAYVMWRILWIHPFFDYNGRIVRLFWELFLMQQWLPLSSFAWASRDDFTRAMQRATQEWSFGDIVELL
jgi:fido (protein-threonine AMPylation protein)